MTHPARRPTTPPAFLGATSTPTPRAEAPATPVPEIPILYSSSPPPPPPPPVPQKKQKKHHRHQGNTTNSKQQHHRPSSRPGRLIRTVRNAFRSFPVIQGPSCIAMPPSLAHHLHVGGAALRGHFFHGATHATGTLYGHRRARITLAFHETPAAPPCLLLEICVPTAKFIQDVSAAGTMVRVTLECDRKQPPQLSQQHHQNHQQHSVPLLDEPLWAAEVNGESVGYAARREATERDERVMQMLHATSMGAGVLPAEMAHPADGELTYMRVHFDRVVGSKDAETYYMHNPEGGDTAPELTIFFIRT
ncbi:hypothetical protein PR202_gb26912 [Eleusine coracana subsp. coracana]|uniref:Protein MIZU-KUSSEI 1 n=1 Tax=Eleusine coracana subsp. coracana TaxID=191504 RepID=A0AAV5FT26_ELECO|nr:hypothetical protein QOZ80_1BG0052750 [Eleusine coracana subsp. coracana]GJN37912.1 hypothetical protein PR202_gb26912 [Eleusine coracana subsp. coracana]